MTFSLRALSVQSSSHILHANSRTHPTAYSLHEFASKSFRTEAHQIIHTNNTSGMPVSAERACNTEVQDYITGNEQCRELSLYPTFTKSLSIKQTPWAQNFSTTMKAKTGRQAACNTATCNLYFSSTGLAPILTPSTVTGGRNQATIPPRAQYTYRVYKILGHTTGNL